MTRILLLAVLLSVLPATFAGQEVPPKWPWHGISLGYPEATPRDIVRYKDALGINMVRLQIKARQYANANHLPGDVALEKGMEWADVMLDECRRLGITAVLNVSQFPLDPALADQTTADFWTGESGRKSVVAVAAQLSAHFNKRGSELAAYDIMSEPVLVAGKESKSPPAWEKVLEQIVNVVGKNDRQRWVVVSPGPWGGPEGYAGFNPPQRERLIWGVHVYMPHRFTHQGIRENEIGIKYPGNAGNRYWDKEALRAALSPLKKFHVTHGGVVMAGEFGAVRWAEGGEQYIRDLTSIFDEYGWGWAYFSGSGWHGWNADYNQNYPGQTNAGAWKSDYVGDGSERWKTLRTIYGTANGKVTQ